VNRGARGVKGGIGGGGEDKATTMRVKKNKKCKMISKSKGAKSFGRRIVSHIFLIFKTNYMNIRFILAFALYFESSRF